MTLTAFVLDVEKSLVLYWFHIPEFMMRVIMVNLLCAVYNTTMDSILYIFCVVFVLSHVRTALTMH